MATFGSRRGFAEKLSLPLMVVAFLAVGGFLYWLNVTAEPTEVAIAEEPAEGDTGAAATLSVTEFLTGPQQWQGQVVEVTGARVASRLGPQAFWIGPDDAPFLVKMAPNLLTDSTRVLVEQSVNLVGTVEMMSDSVLTAWDSLGAFQNESDRIVAEFAVGSPFLEATRVTSQQAGGGSGGGDRGGL